MLCTKGLSLFDFFMRLDVNQSASINKVELKTGMQQLGIVIQSFEFEAFWKAIHKNKKRVQADRNKRKESISDK